MNHLDEYVRTTLQKQQKVKECNIINELKKHLNIMNNVSDDDIISLFDKCISLRQQSIQHNGYNLEMIVKDILKTNHIVFNEQVEIDKNGVIIGIGKKTKKCFHIIDFVIGDIKLKDNIRDYIVLSCKTTCRERWTQDNWSFNLQPMKYILITISDDYPPSSRFRENERRKIMTLKNKKIDDRMYKLSFNNLVEELSLLNKECVEQFLSNNVSEISGNSVS